MKNIVKKLTVVSLLLATQINSVEQDIAILKNLGTGIVNAINDAAKMNQELYIQLPYPYPLSSQAEVVARRLSTTLFLNFQLDAEARNSLTMMDPILQLLLGSRFLHTRRSYNGL